MKKKKKNNNNNNDHNVEEFFEPERELSSIFSKL